MNINNDAHNILPYCGLRYAATVCWTAVVRSYCSKLLSVKIIPTYENSRSSGTGVLNPTLVPAFRAQIPNTKYKKYLKYVFQNRKFYVLPTSDHYAPAPRRRHWAMMRSDVCMTSVCLSRTSGLSREQRGLGRLNIGTEVAHITRDSDTAFEDKRSQGAGAYCGGLPHSLL